ncbi:hypothetical protein RN001_015194 [Aquatica leii]|uniref:Peptidase S1 domain-containing protein n=1 Tax=Aquatica leii TaxID=1421715 RepID=A0AAN7SNF3_9COLE|nr:hypothetical protein RN001_015194 [Aquatica leii]
MLESVKLAKDAKAKTTLQDRRLKRFDICSVRGVKKLIAHVSLAHTLLEHKIVGGTLASEAQFPYQVSIRYFGGHFCGGSIIDADTVLTAAHCVDKKDSTKFHVVVGSNQLNPGGLWYSISHYKVHEDYDPAAATNDIAVMKMLTPIGFTTQVQPIVVDNTFVPDGVKCILSGWGATSYPGPSSNDLLYFTGDVIALDQCKLSFPGSPYPLLDSNICAFARYGVGGCSGDSGGPLVSNNKQIGIASWVALCAVGAPDVYTRVSYFSDWIKTQQAN